ncbi:MAG: murein biosynthesis integral membrane protein MurJ [Peptococcaceae bacterium]|nr:murein biosynthesis integral membrane protein MurJ [Peptococcaceae bacterium]
MSDKNKNTVFKAALMLSIFSGLSKILGFAREQVIAWRFGASALVDSYVAALVIPTVLSGILGGAIAVAFLPVFSTERAKGSGHRLAGTVFALTAFVSLITTIIAFAFAPQIISVLVRDFSLELQALTTSLLRIMAVLTFVMSMTQLLTILFQAHKQFFWPALTPIVMNAIIAVGLVLGGNIQWLAWLTVLGMLIPVMLMTYVAWRRGLPLITRLIMGDPAFKQVMRLSGPIFFSSLFGQLYLLVDRRLASGLDTGSLAALNFGNKLVQLPLGIFVMALTAAVYPTLAEHAAKGDKASFAQSLSSSLRGVTLLLVPAAVGMFVLRYPIVRLAFERGSFDAVATTRTAQALGYYSIGLIGAALAQVLGRGFYSMQDTMTPVKVGVATAFVNVALAVILVRPLAHGGLALANSLGFLFNALLLFYFLSSKLSKGSIRLLPLLIKVSGAAVVMGLVASLVLRVTINFGQVISLGMAVGVGVGVYGLLLIMLRVEEVTTVIKVVRTRLGI